MRYRTVFLAVGAPCDKAVIDRGAEIARALDAHLSVLVMGVAPPPPASPYGVVSSDIWASEIREGQETAQREAQALMAELNEAGVQSSVEGHFIDRGSVPMLAARFARYSDLTLIPPAETGEGTDDLQSWVLNGALFESGRPVLLLPTVADDFPKVRRALIAWDASVEASKAVYAAIDVLTAADAAEIVLIDPVPSFDGHGPEPGADLATYLARHGVSTTVHRLPREGHEIGQLLQRTARDLDADLIVMGGFGHSRLRQRIFGGTTTTMIKGCPVAVMMAH